MAKRKVGPTEQDTHPPRTDMEKFEAIRKIMYRGLTPNSWCLDESVYTQKFRLANYDVIYREVFAVLRDHEVDHSFYSSATSYS